MLLREDILNELREMSPVLADMPYCNVYSVDPGYFSGIESELSARIAADGFTHKKSFTVPDGYFAKLSEDIMQKITAAEQSSGAEDFDKVSPVLSSVGTKNIYSVPADYFGVIAGSVMNKITGAGESVAEELKGLSPVLSGIGNKNIYAVPDNYFESVHFEAAEKQQAKVIRMNPARSVFRYAAAAVITGMIGLSVINIANKNSIKEQPATELAYTTEAVSKANDIIQKGSFDSELNNLSDADIDQYLQESGQDVKAALVVSSATDDSKLPAADDYLLDENTLDTYLKNNNLKN